MQPSTTTLKATLHRDGSLTYQMPKRDADGLLRAYRTCRACANLPALTERAQAAMKALSFLMLDLGVDPNDGTEAPQTKAPAKAS